MSMEESRRGKWEHGRAEQELKAAQQRVTKPTQQPTLDAKEQHI
jgi:hypothetical protein